MRGPRLRNYIDCKSKKNLHVFRCPVFTENIGIVKSKKKVCTSSDVLFFTETIGEEKKKDFIVRDGPPIFSEALGFSLLSLYVNPALLSGGLKNVRTVRSHRPPLKEKTSPQKESSR